MKKILSLLAVASILVFSTSVKASYTVSVTVQPGTFTNLLLIKNGSANLQNITLTATTATNATVLFVDCPTNILWYTNAAYTNTYSYATNLITLTTNFYGEATYFTNFALIDVTNNLVNAGTNYYPVRFGGGAPASGSTYYQSINAYFNDGIWITNTSSGVINVSGSVQQ